MKLVQQIKLQHPIQARKTFSISLYSADSLKFVVRYHYSVDDKDFQEYDKTNIPVNKEQAALVINNLISYKLQKGYEYTQEVETKYLIPLSQESRKDQNETIVKYLKQAVNGQYSKGWSISRVIWRAGELGIKAAVPFLLQLSNRKNKLSEYSLIWSLGRLADPKSLSFLKQTYKKNVANKTENILHNITKEALANTYQGTERQAFLNELAAKLPNDFNQIIATNEKTILNWLTDNCLKSKKTNEFLPIVYLIAKEHNVVRRALLTYMKTSPMKPNHFKGLRQVFKAAEFRRDGEMFGVIAFRFEVINENYKSSSYYAYSSSEDKTVNVSEGQKKGQLAYSEKTRAYFKKRIWRTLRRMGEAGDHNYAEMAKGVLLPYGHSTRIPSTEVKWVFNKKTERFTKRSNRPDSQSSSINFYHILYGNSPRYELQVGAKRWTCTEKYTAGQPAPEVREESFQALWDLQPSAYLDLLARSESGRVHEFATKSLRQHADYQVLIENISTEQILGFLSKPFEQTNELGLNVAQKRYNSQDPNADLVAALMNCSYEKANKIAHNWVAENIAFFFTQTNFVSALVDSKNKVTQKWILENYNPNLLNSDQKTILIEALLTKLINAYNTNITQFLEKHFVKELTTIELSWIKTLLQQSDNAQQVFAGQLLLKHTTPAEALPNDLLNTLLNASNAGIRTIGIQLLGQFSDETLLKKQATLTDYSISSLEDVRQAVRPIIGRLVQKDAAFAQNLVEQFVRLLLRKEKYDGLHEDLNQILTNELKAFLHTVPRKIIFRLLNSKYSPAQKVGILLVQNYVAASTLSVRNIIRLSDHEMLSARQTSWKMFNENVGRMRYERDESIRLLDSDWEDSRAFAFDYFRSNFKAGDWTPETLVGICDSNREDVQDFGKELTAKYFTEENGVEYLLKLSQHPVTKMQNFAAQYLNDYASDDLEMLEKLEFYCKVVLLKVNKGRTAKNIVFKFLEQEAMKNEAAAKIAVRILKRVSLTVAITDKAKCIEILRDIQVKYPNIETPLKIKSVA